MKINLEARTKPADGLHELSVGEEEQMYRATLRLPFIRNYSKTIG